MTFPTITPLPDPPARTAQSNDAFVAAMDAWLVAQQTFATQINALSVAYAAFIGLAITGTSTSSVAVGTGAKSFTTQADRAFIGGQYLRIADHADPANYMIGTVTSYDNSTGALVMNITITGGSGTKSAWDIGLEMAPSALLTLVGYSETVVAPAAGSSFSPDLALGTQFYYQTNANATVTLPSPVAGKSFTVTIKYGGAHTVTWAGGARTWPNGTAPTATSVSGKKDIYTFNCVDGANWDGGQVPNCA